MWLNFSNSLSFRFSQMSQLTLFWHIFRGKKDVKKPCHSSNWNFFLFCYSVIIVLINTEKNWLQLHFSFCLPGHVQLQFAGWSVNLVGRWPVQYCPQFWPALFTLVFHPGFRGFPRSYLWFSDAVQVSHSQSRLMAGFQLTLLIQWFSCQRLFVLLILGKICPDHLPESIQYLNREINFNRP